MQTKAASYSLAIGGVALVAWATCAFLPMLGLASAALLFLLPVLLASARGGLGPGMAAALLGAGAYNFFLLPPRFSLRIHATENLVSVVVLAMVALVTSRLANNLRAREAEASARGQGAGGGAGLYRRALWRVEPVTPAQADGRCQLLLARPIRGGMGAA